MSKEKQNSQIMCLHQLARPQRKSMYTNGHGDCTQCVTDDENKKCSCYYPTSISFFEVIDD